MWPGSSILPRGNEDSFISARYISPRPQGEGAPERGAGIGGTWSRDPLAGCDRGADQWRVVLKPIPCASPGSDPQRGPSSTRRRAPVSGDATVKAHVSTRTIAALHPAAGSHPHLRRGNPAPPSAGAGWGWFLVGQR